MISRRTFLQLMAYSGILSLSNCVGLNAQSPNVLLIVVDSLNNWLSCLGGHPNGSTPHIDQLAQSGLLFNNAHTVGTNKNASRTSLFTGLHPTTSGIYARDINYRDLFPDLTTLPQSFLDLRYQVEGSGRLFDTPDKYSWKAEPYFAFENEFVDHQLSGLNFGPNFDWGALDIDNSQMHDYQVTQWAVERLGTIPDSFFLGVGLSSTRPPWYLPRAEYDRFSPSSVTLPNDATAVLPDGALKLIQYNTRHKAVIEHGQWANAIAAYLACLTYVDDRVGELISALDASEHGDNTIVILTGSHGIHLGDKKYWLYDSLWEQLSHVPLIIRLPKNLREASAGQVCSHAVSSLDIYPTLMELWGRTPPQHVDGRSLVPLLQNPELEWDHPVLIAKSLEDFAVRSNRWRYIRYAYGGEELYEYAGNAEELVNLASSGAHHQVKSALIRYLPQNPAPAAS